MFHHSNAGRDVARFFVTGGIIASAEVRSLVGGGGGGILPSEKKFQFGGSETLFSALVMRYLSPSPRSAPAGYGSVMQLT